MNVLDNLKHLSISQVREYCVSRTIPFRAAMTHISSDFNLSTVIRNANFFGLMEVFYIGGAKQWDRRGSVGTHHYTPLSFYRTEEEFVEMIIEKDYKLISIENNVNYHMESLYNFTFPIDSVILFGEEMKGISDYLLQRSSYIVTIPAFGSVRSLNVGTTSGIVMSRIRENRLTNTTTDL